MTWCEPRGDEEMRVGALRQRRVDGKRFYGCLGYRWTTLKPGHSSSDQIRPRYQGSTLFLGPLFGSTLLGVRGARHEQPQRAFRGQGTNRDTESETRPETSRCLVFLRRHNSRLRDNRFTITEMTPSDPANRQAQKRARLPAPARPAARFQPALPVAVVLGLVEMTAPVLAAPANSLTALTPLIADQAGSVEPASTSQWKCVRRGHCWVPCRGDMCRKACFRTWWSCSVR
jgi:hypothetical protein